MAGIYIHIPFCQSRCIYCDFYSTTLSNKAEYVSALCREMETRKHEISSRVHTIYIGGGTPSTLPPLLLGEIFQRLNALFDIDTDAEITIEANPDDVTRPWLEALRTTPVNRISMGTQTFDDDLLRFLRRRHTSAQSIQAVSLCKEFDYDNISLDLIYGLPGQTLLMWQHDVELLLSLNTKHLSAYALSYEDGTALSRLLASGDVEEADEELSLSMYEYLMDATSRAGMEHYEISNFAYPGYRSRHNSSYWQSKPYLGLGAGAHSYDGRNVRRANQPDIKAYIAAVNDVPHEMEYLTPDEVRDEIIMTRLRTREGLCLSSLPTTDRQLVISQATPHIKAGRLELTDDMLRLTRTGIFTSNDIISDLMMG